MTKRAERADRTQAKNGAGSELARVVEPMLAGMTTTRHHLPAWVQAHGLAALDEQFLEEAVAPAGGFGDWRAVSINFRSNSSRFTLLPSHRHSARPSKPDRYRCCSRPPAVPRTPPSRGGSGWQQHPDGCLGDSWVNERG